MTFESKLKSLFPIVFVLFVVVVGTVFLPYGFSWAKLETKENPNTQTQRQLSEYADEIVAKCADSSYKPTCYDEEIPKLMEVLTMEQAFLVTSHVQGLDRSYTYCHVLGHKLSAQETAKDPSLWKQVVMRSPRGICSNGAIHGAFQERFRKESLTDAEITQFKPELEDVCEPKGSWKPTGLEQGSCYHAFGHLMMYITDGILDRALPLCTELTLKSNGRDWRQLCYDGAFMQIQQPLEPDDFALVKGKQPTAEQMVQYCSKYTGLMRAPCWSEGWPLFRDQILTSSGLEKFCKKQFLTVTSDINRCFNALFFVVTAQLQLSDTKVAEFCGGLTDAYFTGKCYANGASRMIETDYRNVTSALALCDNAPENPRKMCFDEMMIVATYNFAPGSSEQVSFCGAMPDGWKQTCQNNIRRN